MDVEGTRGSLVGVGGRPYRGMAAAISGRYRRRHVISFIRRHARLLVAAGLLVIVVIAGGVLWSRSLFRVAVCDAWSVDLRDGTVLYAPGYESTSDHSGFGPCWTLPEGVTMEDLATTY